MSGPSGQGTPPPQQRGPSTTPPGIPALTAVPATLASGAGGSIYDLGYRGYDGPRLGRPHAIRALFIHSLKVAYGIGRGGRAKLAPVVLGGFAIIPAIVGVGFIALARQLAAGGEQIEDANPISHESYFGFVTVFVVLFCAIQAPEMVGRDQRYSLTSLYFSRALRRLDYSLARFGGMLAALLVFVLLPHVIIFGGLVLSAKDIGAELGSELAFVPPVLGQALLIGCLLGSIATVVSAFTPRRLYATTTIVVLLAVTPIISEVLIELGTKSLAQLLVLLSPADVLNGTNAYFFGSTPGKAIREADLDGIVYVGAALAVSAACLAVLIRRIEKIVA